MRMRAITNYKLDPMLEILKLSSGLNFKIPTIFFLKKKYVKAAIKLPIMEPTITWEIVCLLYLTR